MTEPYLSTCYFGLALIIVAWFRQLALWQRKEYRFDRLWSNITSQELTTLTSVGLYIFYASVALGWASYLLSLPMYARLFGWVALLGFLVHIGQDIFHRGFTRPHPTPKIFVLAAISGFFMLIGGLFTFIVHDLLALQWATFIYFLPAIVGLAVAITNLPARYRKRQIIRQAGALRARLKNLRVIGITGSLGKTSTKHFLQQIMAASPQKVVATKAHRNAEFTVAQDMLEQLKPRTKLYIAEMGAYRRGEIADLAKLTQPQFGLITAIANQHAALFGSTEDIAAAKWELIKALPSDGTAILNADDPTLVELGPAAPCPVVWYSTHQNADVRLSNITYQPEKTTFTIRVNGQQRQVTTPVISAGLIQSIAAATAAAHALGLSLADIAQQLRQLEPYPRTMELKDGLKGCTIIDDSHSASEGSINNALEHLARFPQKDKRIALVPIIELGSLGPEVHQKIGQLLGNLKAQVFIYGLAYQKDFQKGLEQSSQNATVTWHRHPARFTEHLTTDLSDQTVLLLEGRMPDVVHKALR